MFKRRGLAFELNVFSPDTDGVITRSRHLIELQRGVASPSAVLRNVVFEKHPDATDYDITPVSHRTVNAALRELNRQRLDQRIDEMIGGFVLQQSALDDILAQRDAPLYEVTASN